MSFQLKKKRYEKKVPPFRGQKSKKSSCHTNWKDDLRDDGLRNKLCDEMFCFCLMHMQCSFLWPFWVAPSIKGRVNQASFNLYAFSDARYYILDTEPACEGAPSVSEHAKTLQRPKMWIKTAIFSYHPSIHSTIILIPIFPGESHAEIHIACPPAAF